MSIIVDLVMIIGIVGLLIAGVIQVLACFMHLYEAFKWIKAVLVTMRLRRLGMKAQGQPVVPDMEEEVFTEEELEEEVKIKLPPYGWSPGRHHCSVGKGNEGNE